jgi:hypothetical protein
MKQKPPHPSRPRIPEAKQSPHLKHKKRYTDKSNAEKKTLRSDYIYATGVKNSSVM